ncbi:MAG: metal-dependent transcriptional regulator [Candidatus Hermodarchaeota archaeon]
MSRMLQSHSQEEILEHLWINLIEDKNESISKDDLSDLVKDHDPDVATTLKDLIQEGDIYIDANQIFLNETGILKGRQIVRRHRLAERLLKDVINLPFEKLESNACSFEHILNRDVEQNICILLGHPTVCPHGKEIPPGRCCTQKTSIVHSVIRSLEDIEPGYEGIIAYITTKKHGRLQKLMSFGVLPGVPLKIVRKTPGTVIKIDETVIALESDINSSIFLRNIRKTIN